MALIQGSDPRILKSKGDSIVFQVVFGGIFAVMGLFAVVTGINETIQKGPGPALVAAVVGTLFLLVGLAIMTARTGVVIDARAGTVTSWWRCLLFGKRREIPLDQLDHVSVKREVRRSKNSSYTVYPVRLIGEEKPLDLEEPRDFGQARATAEQIAKLLKLDIYDTTSGKKTVREHDRLDESIREKAKRDGETVDVPDPPAGTRVQFSIEGNELTLELPAKGLSRIHMLLIPAMIVPIFVVGFILSGLFHDIDMPRPVMYLIAGFVGVFFVGVPLLIVVSKVLQAKRQRTRIVASLKELRIEEHGVFGKKSTAFPADEMEELTLSTPQEMPPEVQQLPPFLKKLAVSAARRSSRGGIHARSDKASAQFAGHLSAEEQRWIHAIITRMLTA